MSDDTLLTLTGAGLPPYSARGLTQTLEPIAAATYQRRDLNYKLHNLAHPKAAIYRSVISCTDRQPPAFDGLFPGAILSVECAVSLCRETTSDGLNRQAVSGSTVTSGGFTKYRPVLQMMVVSCPGSFDEWQAENGWEIELEEVEMPT